MRRQDDSPGIVSVLGPPTAVALAATLLVVLPNEIRIGLTLWTLASIPVGVLFGHCVLNEE